MFGRTKERIRQYFQKYKLQRNWSNKTMYRIWINEKNCFVPISCDGLEKILKRNEKKKKTERVAQMRKKHITAIQDFEKEYGRAPHVTELLEILGYNSNHTSSLVVYWGYSPRGSISYQQAIDSLYREAGFEERPNRHNKL